MKPESMFVLQRVLSIEKSNIRRQRYTQEIISSLEMRSTYLFLSLNDADNLSEGEMPWCMSDTVWCTLPEGALSTSMHAILTLLVIVFLVACEQSQLVQDVSQNQALEIVSELSQRNITSEAQKQQGIGGSYQVVVAPEDYNRSVTILHSLGLPGKEEVSVSDLLKSSSFLPQSRTMEGIKIDRALSIELESHLSKIPGVVEADVFVRTVSDGLEKKRALSVVVSHEKGVEVPRNLVLMHLNKTFPDISDAHIMLSVLPIKSRKEGVSAPMITGGKSKGKTRTLKSGRVPFLVFFEVEKPSYFTAAMFVVGFIVLLCLFGMVVGYTYAEWVHYRKSAAAMRSGNDPKVLASEGNKHKQLGEH